MAAVLRPIIAMCLPALLFASDNVTEPDAQNSTEPAGQDSTEPDVQDLLSKIELLTKRVEEIEKVNLPKVEAMSDGFYELEANVTEMQENMTQDPMEFCKNASAFSPICGLERILQQSENEIGWFFMNSVMLGIGVALVLLYHLSKLAPGDWLQSGRRTHKGKLVALRLLGRNLVILQLYYTDFQWTNGILKNPFYHSLGFISFDTVILWFGCKQLASQVGTWKEQIPEEKDTYIRTRYTDWSQTTGHVTAVFVGQVCLFLLFLMYLNEDPETHDPDNVIIFQWVVGVVVTNIAGSEETGVEFQNSVWKSIDRDWKNFNEHPDNERVEPPEKYKIWARWLYDMIINAFCREVLLGLAPVVLATSERWDFIKDCLAIFFISRLDDLDDHKNINVCIKAYAALDKIPEPERDEERHDPLLDGRAVSQ